MKKALATSAFLPFAVRAQDPGNGPSLLPTPATTISTSVTKITQDRRHILSGEFRAESLQYLTTVDNAPDLDQTNFMSGRMGVVGSPESAPWLTYAGDLSAGTFFRNGQDQFVVNELYLSGKLSSWSSVTMGRKKALWSRMDEVWQLGLWEPRFAIDTLRPEEQGLTGFFFNIGNDDFELMGFATPLFIPNMGPEISEQDGSLVPKNRWYRRPSSTQIFNNRLNAVNYDLDVPQIDKLVLNPATALMARSGNLRDGLWAIGSWGFKPVNDLLLRRQIVRIVDQPLFDVKVAPDVAYHEMMSADVGYTFKTVQLSASYLQDHPQVKVPEEDWAIQKLRPLQAFSLQGEWSPPQWVSRSMQVQFGYLRILGADIVDIDSAKQVEAFTLFDERMRFTNATFVGLEGELFRLWKRPFNTKLRYLYDRDQQGSLMKTEFLYYPRADIGLVVGADILGVQNDDVEPDGFLNQYRANDRYYGGVTYVF